MTQIYRHPLLQQAYEVCLAIEECGASIELTNAVTKASALLSALDKFIPVVADHIEPHQQRVIGEKVQLDDKLAKLGAALNNGLREKVGADEFSRLCEQERVMREYSEILRQRIANFESAR